MSARRLIFLVTEDQYFYSHRLPTVRAAQQAGCAVAVITRVTTRRAAIEAAGVRVIPLSLDRRSLNPFRAFKHVLQIAAIYRREKPDIVHHIAMKPVLYGSLAASLARVPRVVNAFAGLGYVFTADDGLARVLRPVLLGAFRVVLKRPGRILLLQNDDDAALLRRHGLAPAGRTHVIRGSGIELARYRERPLPPVAPDIICAFAGRMIGIKGLQTLKDAFALLAVRAPRIKLWLCGAPDPANPGSWTEEQLRDWTANVTYRGPCDMAEIWARAHIAVQPSWGGEGVPKALLEAMACGRAIVATDVPGCRDVVTDENGILVPPRDAAKLADAIALLAADPASLRARGQASRRLVVEKGLAADNVTAQAEALYRALLAGG